MSAPAIPRRPFPWAATTTVTVLVVCLAAAAVHLDLDIASVFTERSLDAAGETLGRLWPPTLDEKTLGNAGKGVLETLSMSLVGTLVGAAIGLVLMPFCCETLLVRGPLVEEEDRPLARSAAAQSAHQAARLVANVLRTVPYFVWAVLFWFMVGPGTFPGALAIAVHTGGVIAKNYALALDQTDLRPQAALRAAGARRAHVFLFGMLPSARAALASYTLYRWEVNIRESTVLGLVGAGGLGYHLSLAMGIRDWNAAATHLGAIIVLVLAVDALSAVLRRRMM